MLILPNWQHSQDLWQRISASRYDGPHSDLTHMLSWCAAQSCAIPEADIRATIIGDAERVADDVCSQAYCVELSRFHADRRRIDVGDDFGMQVDHMPGSRQRDHE